MSPQVGIFSLSVQIIGSAMALKHISETPPPLRMCFFSIQNLAFEPGHQPAGKLGIAKRGKDKLATRGQVKRNFKSSILTLDLGNNEVDI